MKMNNHFDWILWMNQLWLLYYYQKGLSACVKLNYKEGIARSNAELADMYLDQGDTVHAIELYKKVVSIVEEMNNKPLLARAIMQA